jgi:hypothetical protein
MAKKLNKSFRKKSIRKRKSIKKKSKRKNKRNDGGFTVEQNYVPYGCYVPKAFF